MDAHGWKTVPAVWWVREVFRSKRRFYQALEIEMLKSFPPLSLLSWFLQFQINYNRWTKLKFTKSEWFVFVNINTNRYWRVFYFCTIMMWLLHYCVYGLLKSIDFVSRYFKPVYFSVLLLLRKLLNGNRISNQNEQ